MTTQEQTQDAPKTQEFVIPQHKLEDLARYLMQRPWHEVNALIAEIQNLQPLEDRIKDGPSATPPPTPANEDDGKSAKDDKGSKKKSSKKKAGRRKGANGASTADADAA